MKHYYFNTFKILIILTFLNISSACAKSAGEYLDSGNDFFKLGQVDAAIVEYAKAIEINPNYAKAYNNRGVAYAQEGSLQRAIADFTMAIADKPTDAEAYNNRGHAYDQLGNLSQAVHDYTKAIKYNAFYVKAYNNRKIVFYKLKKYDRAWSDVHTLEEIGGAIDPEFIKELKKVSGRDQ